MYRIEYASCVCEIVYFAGFGKAENIWEERRVKKKKVFPFLYVYKLFMTSNKQIINQNTFSKIWKCEHEGLMGFPASYAVWTAVEIAFHTIEEWDRITHEQQDDWVFEFVWGVEVRARSKFWKNTWKVYEWSNNNAASSVILAFDSIESDGARFHFRRFWCVRWMFDSSWITIHFRLPSWKI